MAGGQNVGAIVHDVGEQLPVGGIRIRRPAAFGHIERAGSLIDATERGACNLRGRGALLDDCAQRGAAAKRLIADGLQTCRQDERGQAGAVLEGFVVDGGDTLAHGQSRQARATLEGARLYHGHAARNGYPRQGTAVEERAGANPCHGIGDAIVIADAFGQEHMSRIFVGVGGHRRSLRRCVQVVIDAIEFNSRPAFGGHHPA